MDEVTGGGSAELLDDGSIEITFAYHNWDEAIPKANGILLQQPAEAFPLLNGMQMALHFRFMPSQVFNKKLVIS
ncbi:MULTISPECIES: hypothetical protein [unclassified Mesorhizobium]|uniref:hypothetical protein n=1 Tax=unclassified Mesorhizobium TaxID=325217 RepID=UPI0012EBBF3A|nr:MULTISPECIES: hypothetical protein [unclassified Mesorhizobium]WJI50386.1 hypothetical protein NLY44_28270 [Mesorhizobium sp. C089B]